MRELRRLQRLLRLHVCFVRNELSEKPGVVAAAEPIGDFVTNGVDSFSHVGWTGNLFFWNCYGRRGWRHSVGTVYAARPFDRSRITGSSASRRPHRCPSTHRSHRVRPWR